MDMEEPKRRKNSREHLVGSKIGGDVPRFVEDLANRTCVCASVLSVDLRELLYEPTNKLIGLFLYRSGNFHKAALLDLRYFITRTRDRSTPICFNAILISIIVSYGDGWVFPSLSWQIN